MIFKSKIKNVAEKVESPMVNKEDAKDHLFLKVVNIPETLEGDKSFYASKHMDYLKEVYAEFVKTEAPYFKEASALEDIVDSIQNIKTVEEWKSSKDVADFEAIAKVVIEKMDDVPKEYDALDDYSYNRYEISQNGNVMMNLDKFCFDNYDNFEEAVAKKMTDLEARSQAVVKTIEIYGGKKEDYKKLNDIANFSEKISTLAAKELEQNVEQNMDYE